MTLHLSTATVWIQQHATVAVGSFEMLAFFHLYMYIYLCFWKAVCLQHHSLIPSQREESRLKVTVVWRLFLDNQRKFRSDCSWQSGPYPPACDRGLSPTTGWVKQPVLLFHFAAFFSLVDSVLTNSFPLLLFFLYSPPSHSLSVRLHLSAPSLLSACVHAVGQKLLWQTETLTGENRLCSLAGRWSPAELLRELRALLRHWKHVTEGSERLTPPNPGPLCPPLFHLAQDMRSNSIQTTFHFIFHEEIFGEDFSIHLADCLMDVTAPPHLQLWYHRPSLQLPS